MDIANNYYNIPRFLSSTTHSLSPGLRQNLLWHHDPIQATCSPGTQRYVTQLIKHAHQRFGVFQDGYVKVHIGWMSADQT